MIERVDRAAAASAQEPEELAEQLAVACGADRAAWRQRTKDVLDHPQVLYTDYGTQLMVNWHAMEVFRTLLAETRRGVNGDARASGQ
jgi:hypothetical protein